MTDPLYVAKTFLVSGDISGFTTATLANPATEAGQLVVLYVLRPQGVSIGNSIDGVSTDGTADSVDGSWTFDQQYNLLSRYWLSVADPDADIDLEVGNFGDTGLYAAFAMAFSHEGGFDDLVFQLKGQSTTNLGALDADISKALTEPASGYQHDIITPVVHMGFQSGAAAWGTGSSSSGFTAVASEANSVGGGARAWVVAGYKIESAAETLAAHVGNTDSDGVHYTLAHVHQGYTALTHVEISEDAAITVDLRLVKVKESDPPYNVPTGMADARQR